MFGKRPLKVQAQEESLPGKVIFIILSVLELSAFKTLKIFFKNVIHLGQTDSLEVADILIGSYFNQI